MDVYKDSPAIRGILSGLGLPSGDSFDLAPSSSGRFEDGGQFRIEVPTINSAAAMEELLDQASARGIRLNRITETLGMFRHSREEILKYVSLANQAGVELLMSVGPRAVYDTSASANTPQGKMVGYRLRGQEQVMRAIKDVMRGLELGVRGFVVYDEGLLWLLNKMREEGVIPSEVHLKVSAHMGHGNPASAKVMEMLGADSINPIRDLQLPMLAAIRRAVTVPMDVHADNPAESGGFIRFYEVADIIRLVSPVHIKTGNSVLQRHGMQTSPEEARKMIEQVCIVLEMVGRDLPNARQSGVNVV